MLITSQWHQHDKSLIYNFIDNTIKILFTPRLMTHYEVHKLSKKQMFPLMYTDILLRQQNIKFICYTCKYIHPHEHKRSKYPIIKNHIEIYNFTWKQEAVQIQNRNNKKTLNMFDIWYIKIIIIIIIIIIICIEKAKPTTILLTTAMIQITKYANCPKNHNIKSQMILINQSPTYKLQSLKTHNQLDFFEDDETICLQR
jgi:hypothetical protein